MSDFDPNIIDGKWVETDLKDVFISDQEKFDHDSLNGMVPVDHDGKLNNTVSTEEK